MAPDLRKIDGLGMLNILKAAPRTSDAMVAVLTDPRDHALQVRCLEEGAAYFYPRGSCSSAAIAKQLRDRLIPPVVCCPGSLSSGRVTLTLAKKIARVGGADVGLTEREFELLAYLMKHSPRVVRWQELQRKIWSWNERQIAAKQPGVIHVTVSHLRVKLGSAADCIAVHKFVGLRFCVS
jgi:DNA-binding response OmpR family regulator